MRAATSTRMIAFAYFRLSNEEAQAGESASIANQRMLVEDYCKHNNIILAREFVDDGYSGANFDRPGFRAMMSQLETDRANTVLTKDLSRLGRDMVEASYYAETFFPEREIRYIATHDNFDSASDNIMAPFQFAMNEVYLRDGSRKVRNVIYSKRERGEYCACPPYGYRKNPANKQALLPDENTAPVVTRIFESAAEGDSSRKIAMELTREGIIPPLKYRIYHRDNFGESGAARASDDWNYTTVKRILKNEVYLGHTLLGKSKKVNVKSQKKLPIAKDKWCVTENTHPPLVTQKTFDLAQKNLGKGTKDFRQHEHVRKSIFSGIAVCELCGYSMCSAGTVYKGEREKYWYLQCTHQRKDIPNPCPGKRIRYTDLLELIQRELNALISLPDEEKRKLAREAAKKAGGEDSIDAAKVRADKAHTRIETIDKIITKLYHDNINGTLDDNRLVKMVDELERETKVLQKVIADTRPSSNKALQVEENYRQFFDLISYYTDIDEVDRKILKAFVEKIVIGPKVFPEGYSNATHDTTPFTQSINIFYRFIGSRNS
ncbi:MAG: recombinase family protein [Oscillospiraceae bacterium]|nr:recombinase family protein [Oscillospiraceae bacterium]